MSNTIPRVIHYCWFGGNPVPESARQCMESWKKYCPGYEIKCWDESNYDIHACQYVQEAYEAKKWAFVSDYARFDILYHHGGIYFDVDVELIAPIEDILEKGPFLGIERNLEQKAMVAPGLGMAAPAGLPVYGEILEHYQNLRFLNEDGTYNQTTVVNHTTDMLSRFGLQNGNELQPVAGIWIYPWDYFCPVMYQTGEMDITANTRSIHHYHASWLAKAELHWHKVQLCLCKRFGSRWGTRLAGAYSFPHRVCRKLKKEGFRNTVRFAVRKLTAAKNEKECAANNDAKGD